MGEKRSKYDTDPLDPDFVRKTEEMSGATREVTRTPNEQARRSPDAEAPTRRFDEPLSTSYPSVFIPPPYKPPAAIHHHAGTSSSAPPLPTPSRHIPGIGLPEKFAGALPYAPFYIGVVAAIIELLLVPRREVRTRFHAAQGLALQLTLIVITSLLSIIGLFARGAAFGGRLISIAGFIFMVISMIRVWKGEEHRIAPLADATKWLNEQFEPRK